MQVSLVTAEVKQSLPLPGSGKTKAALFLPGLCVWRTGGPLWAKGMTLLQAACPQTSPRLSPSFPCPKPELQVTVDAKESHIRRKKQVSSGSLWESQGTPVSWPAMSLSIQQCLTHHWVSGGRQAPAPCCWHQCSRMLNTVGEWQRKEVSLERGRWATPRGGK